MRLYVFRPRSNQGFYVVAAAEEAQARAILRDDIGVTNTDECSFEMCSMSVAICHLPEDGLIVAHSDEMLSPL